MKRWLLALLTAVLLVGTAAAQSPDAQLIVLDDAVPAVDIVISLPPDTSGAISLDLNMASALMTTSEGVTVLYAADPRVYAIELDIAANTGAHTITLERLPGMTTAYVTLTALAGLTATDGALQVTGGVLENRQEQLLTLSPSAPGSSVEFSVPDSGPSVLSALMPRSQMTAQVIDSSGAAVVTAYSDLIGVNVVLGAGKYSLTLLGKDLSGDVNAGVRLQSLADTQLTVMAPRLTPGQTALVESAAPSCTAQVTVSSANLRSGPGTGYSVLDYAYNGETYPVGGSNTLGNWIVIGKDGSSGWISRNLTALSGSCTDLTVFNVPFRNAAAPAIIVQTVPDTATSGGGVIIQAPPADNHDDDDDDDDHEEDHSEDHDDDDDDN